MARVDSLDRVSKCENCGAAYETPTFPFTCKFCGTTNAAPPKEVRVAVPMQIVQQVIQVTGTASAADAGELRCPLCQQRLVTARVLDVALSGCGGCGGIWIDNESARKIVEKPDAVFADLAARAAKNAKHGRPTGLPKCPSCKVGLDRVTSQGIELDVCSQHGTWFDVGELRRLVNSLRGEDLRAKPPSADDLIACVECRTQIVFSRANLSEYGPKCDACWRTQQQQAIRTADQGHAQSAGVLVGAALLVGVLGVALGDNRSRS